MQLLRRCPLWGKGAASIEQEVGQGGLVLESEANAARHRVEGRRE